MNLRRIYVVLVVSLAAFAVAPAPRLRAQQLDTALYQGLRWRGIGPYRGGRTKAVVGVPQQPGLFYVGFVNGGVWRSTDYGRVWTPIFDDQPTGSIGALAVAPSNPRILYAGSGEGMQRPDLTVGNGIYRSGDGGETWTHLGLRDGQQIPQIQVDPRDPNRIFVAVLGHPYGPNEERGVFRSTDGGQTFDKVLYRGPTVGAADVTLDPVSPDVVYADLWESQEGPWENAHFSGPASGLYKSVDGGSSWQEIGRGLPTGAEGLGRVGIGIAPSMPNRIYAVVGAPRDLGGLYRSDDAGETFRRVQEDPRIWGRDGDFNEVKVDPTDPDVVYVANVVTWKSTDAGETFQAFRGAPGGDDYQRIWIDPTDPRIIALAADQGVVITVNGGQTFSSWYNQPTAQFYHVNTDNDFPYRVCGGQQESGSACVKSRSDDGQITFRDWHPVGVEEYGYAVPDPLDPDIVYGGKVSRYDRRTGDVQNVGPRPLRGDDYFVVRTQPVVFAPTDPHTLYFASNVLWRTRDGGQRWQQISPDLTRTDSLMPGSIAHWRDQPEARAHHRGVIYTIAPSYVKRDWIWVGTDDGLIQLTRDGGRSWTDVTPAQIRDRSWSKVSIMDASHTDTLTAYAAVNTLRLDDLRPHIYVTHDGGATWTERVDGIPGGTVTNTVKEDPVRPGLLFAGTEQEVFFSVDDGAHWQSLRRNMPATSIRDLVIKDNDLVVGTHGRGFWILDDISPLRQMDAGTARAPARLFGPGQAWRFRWNRWTDTPLPPDEPAGRNPPDGAILYYWLGERPSGPVTLEILDDAGAVVRAFSSDDEPEPMLEGQQVPPRWVRPPELAIPSAAPGMHRFVWDLHYEPPKGMRRGYPISAIDGYTPAEPRGPVALPGEYTVRLTVDGTSYTQTLRVRMDPRVETGPEGLRRQFDLSMRIKAVLDRRDETDQPGFVRVTRELEGLYRILQQSDAAPTPRVVELVERRLREAEAILGG
ncbi:MAG: glycoside hydrolase [Gemmatimonadota bacterium]|jgi:photosystem II stability/assembly factor-like uncharacterized protein